MHFSLVFQFPDFGNLHTKVEISLLPTRHMHFSSHNDLFNHIIMINDPVHPQHATHDPLDLLALLAGVPISRFWKFAHEG